jgi:hypothetical protein
VYYSKKFLDALGIDYHEYKQEYNKENRPLLHGVPGSIPFVIGLGIGIVATIIILFIPASPVSSPFLSIVHGVIWYRNIAVSILLFVTSV